MNAVRVWYTDHHIATLDDPGYHVCYDENGAPLLPTGSVDSPGQLLEVPDTVVSTKAVTEGPEPPVVVNRETGLSIEFVRHAGWRYNADIGMSELVSDWYTWNDASSKYEREVFPANQVTYTYYPLNSDGTYYITSIDNDGGTWSTSRHEIEEGLPNFSYTQSNAYMETTAEGFRIWYWDDFQERGTSYQEYTFSRRLPNGSIQRQPFIPTVTTEDGEETTAPGEEVENPPPEDDAQGDADSDTDGPDTNNEVTNASGGGGSSSVFLLFVLLYPLGSGLLRQACFHRADTRTSPL